ncbi:DMT family transporter [bacterium]|nr:DMT family transporter [bacterium]
MSSHPHHHYLRGILFMTGAGLFFSLMVACVKFSALTVPVAQVVCFRSGVSALFTTGLMYFRGIPFRAYNVRLLFLRSLSGTVALGLSFYAASTISLVDMSLLLKSSVVFTTLFAIMWLGERPSVAVMLYTVLAFFGVGLLLRPTGEVFQLGGAAAFAAAIFIGWNGVLLKKLHETDHSLMTIFCYCWMATIFYGLFFPIFVTPNSAEIFGLLGAGVAGTAGQICFTEAFKYGNASTVSPYIYSEVIFATTIGALFFGEGVTVFSVVGACCIVTAGLGLMRDGRRTAQLPGR